MNNPQDSQATEYLVHHQEQVQGPFNVDFIEAMILAEVYPHSVMVQKKGTSSWIPFSSVVAAPSQMIISLGPVQAGSMSATPPEMLSDPPAKKPRPRKTKPETVVAQIVGVFGVLALVWIVALVTSSTRKARSRTGSSYTPTSSKNAYTPPVVSTPPTRPVHSTSRSVLPVDDSKIYRDASGRSYRVSNIDYNRLLTMRSALTPKKVRMDQSEEELKSLHRKIESERTYLDRTDQYAVDSFNRNVNRLNAMNGSLQFEVDDFNRDVDAFNAELERVGTPIN